MLNNTCKLCIAHLIDTGYTLVCPECGLETKASLDTRNCVQLWHQPDASLMSTHYSRLNRFIRLIDSVILPSTSKKDERMLEYLFKHQNKISTPRTLLHIMHKSKLPNKRYNNFHMFQKLFCVGYVKPKIPDNYFNFKRILIKQFRSIEFAHRKANMQQFFNYSWLLRFLLEEYTEYQPYLRFIKKIKCKKRSKFYMDMIDELMPVV